MIFSIGLSHSSRNCVEICSFFWGAQHKPSFGMNKSNQIRADALWTSEKNETSLDKSTLGQRYSNVTIIGTGSTYNGSIQVAANEQR